MTVNSGTRTVSEEHSNKKKIINAHDERYRTTEEAIPSMGRAFGKPANSRKRRAISLKKHSTSPSDNPFSTIAIANTLSGPSLQPSSPIGLLPDTTYKVVQFRHCNSNPHRLRGADYSSDHDACAVPHQLPPYVTPPPKSPAE